MFMRCQMECFAPGIAPSASIVTPQARVSGLDGRLAGLQQDMERLQERLSVLRAKAEKINPENKVVSSETLRWVLVCGRHLWSYPGFHTGLLLGEGKV